MDGEANDVLDVSPRPTMKNVLDRAAGYAVFSRQLVLGHAPRLVSLPDLPHFGFSQAGRSLIFAACRAVRIVSALCNHVGDVVGASTQEQMRRVAAWRVIAPVKDTPIVRRRAKGEFVSEPVSRNCAPLVSQLAVAELEPAPTPLPAVAAVWCSRNSFPECRRGGFMRHLPVHSNGSKQESKS